MTGVAVLAAGGLLAACGDDNNKTETGSGGSSTTAATSSESSTTTGPAAALTVTVKKDSKLGNILADPDGKTLYTLTDGSGKAIACTGPCLAAWPPVKVAAGATEPTGPTGVVLKAVTGSDGTKLIAVKGLPLYTYAGDASATDANGEGIQAFGGTWHAAKTDADVTSGTGGSGSSGGSGGDTSETTTTASSTY
jgi:predicted lipoprotein with Yx(FWY)xxD motif